MKSTRYPAGLPCQGRFKTQDIPTLRALREAYRSLLDKVPEVLAGETDPGLLLAGATIKADLEAKYAACGSALDRLERTAARWRP